MCLNVQQFMIDCTALCDWFTTKCDRL